MAPGVDSKASRRLEMLFLTNHPTPKFLSASPLRQSHIFTSSCAPLSTRQADVLGSQGKVPLILRPSCLQHATLDIRPTPVLTHTGIPASQRAEEMNTGRSEGMCAIGCGQRWGMWDDAQHSSAFPFLAQRFLPFHPARPRREVPPWWATAGLELT